MIVNLNSSLMCHFIQTINNTHSYVNETTTMCVSVCVCFQFAVTDSLFRHAIDTFLMFPPLLFSHMNSAAMFDFKLQQFPFLQYNMLHTHSQTHTSFDTMQRLGLWCRRNEIILYSAEKLLALTASGNVYNLLLHFYTRWEVFISHMCLLSFFIRYIHIYIYTVWIYLYGLYIYNLTEVKTPRTFL